MKRTGFLFTIILIFAAGNITAQEKGNLTLNLEPRIGLSIPYKWDTGYGGGGTDVSDAGMGMGIDYAITGNVHYYFADFVSVNAGLGFTGYFNGFYTGKGRSGQTNVFGGTSNSGRSRGENIGNLSAFYLTIPAGVRLTFKLFSIGTGITGNIPLGNSGVYIFKTTLHNDYGGGSFEQEIEFNTLSFMGWYIDIGFSPKSPFSFALLYNAPFVKSTAVPVTEVNYIASEKLKHDFSEISLYSLSAVLRINIPLKRKSD